MTDIELHRVPIWYIQSFMITVKWGSNLFYGNEPNRVLGPKEQEIYEHYQRYCWQFDILPASEERWRMESQKIPNV